MITSYDIIQTLIRTEKGTRLEAERKYIFQVSVSANKIEIKRAIEQIYKVKVKEVNIIIVPGKKKGVRRDLGYTSNWKKAIVTLQEGQTINVT